MQLLEYGDKMLIYGEITTSTDPFNAFTAYQETYQGPKGPALSTTTSTVNVHCPLPCPASVVL